MAGARSVIICFGLSALNVIFIVKDPMAWWNWAAAVFCFGLGIALAIMAAR